MKNYYKAWLEKELQTKKQNIIIDIAHFSVYFGIKNLMIEDGINVDDNEHFFDDCLDMEDQTSIDPILFKYGYFDSAFYPLRQVSNKQDSAFYCLY